MNFNFEDPNEKERKLAMRFRLLFGIVITMSLIGVWLLYQHVPWIKNLLGTNRGTIGLGIMILASPLILLVYLLGKLRR